MIIEKLILFQIMAVCPMREANWLLPLLTYAFFWPFGGGGGGWVISSYSWITSFKRPAPLEPRFLDAVFVLFVGFFLYGMILD